MAPGIARALKLVVQFFPQILLILRELIQWVGRSVQGAERKKLEEAAKESQEKKDTSKLEEGLGG